MKISAKKLKSIIKSNGFNLESTLEKAGVSKTAYYSLLNKESILPKSIQLIAETLGVNPSRFLEEESDEEKLYRKLLKTLDKIMKKHPEANRENVWHTLLLLQEEPIERLRRGLLRAQNNIHN